MMVSANFCAAVCVDSQESITSGNLARIFLNCSGTPIMPVEEREYLVGRYAQELRSLGAYRRKVAIPGFPVAQLALPELTTTARTLPLDFASDSRATVSGAATMRFLGKYLVSVPGTVSIKREGQADAGF